MERVVPIKAKDAEGEQPLRPSLQGRAQFGAVIVGLGSLSDDLRGVVHHAQCDRYEHGAGGDEGVKLGHEF